MIRVNRFLVAISSPDRSFLPGRKQVYLFLLYLTSAHVNPLPMSTHRLAAVLFADIVGYTALMQADEASGIAKASRLRAVMTALVPKHRGELIEMRGDGALCVFGSSVEAVRCAQGIQRELQAEVPLRIGIHLGDITQREGHLYGDAVNVASRIESMGVAGAVLLSSSIRQQIRNKPEFELISLGKVAFKNVVEPMTVYALANDGLVVPAHQGSASRASSLRPSIRRAMWSILGVLLFVSGGWWAFQDYGKKSPAALPADLQQERVAVLPFVNQTGQPDLNILGSLISDWLSKGLLELEGTTVLDADNILALLETGSSPQRWEANKLDLAEIKAATGVAVVIEGDYYQVGDSILVQARITETGSQNLLKALSTRTTETDVLAALDGLTNQVLNFWAVKGQERFSRNPPAYASYQAYEQASAITITDPAQAERLFWQAYQQDSTFLAPLFGLVNLYVKEGNDSAKRTVINLLAANQAKFTRWESIRFRRLNAALAGKWLLAGRLAQQQFEQDPSDLSAFAYAISSYNQANAPQLALNLHQQIDSRLLRTQKHQQLNWGVPRLAFCFYQLKRYEAVDSLARSYNLPLIPDALGVLHLKALAQLGRWEIWEQQMRKYFELGVVNTSGQLTPIGQLLPLICDELLLLGEQERLQVLALELKAWADSHPTAPDHHRGLGFAHYYLGDYREAYHAWQEERPFSPSLPGWLQLNLKVSRLGRLAICQAKLDDAESAERYRQQIEKMDSSNNNWPETQQYHLARIWVALGQEAKALQSLQRAIDGGYSFFQPAVYGSDPFLLPLRGNPAFEALIAPRDP